MNIDIFKDALCKRGIFIHSDMQSPIEIINSHERKASCFAVDTVEHIDKWCLMYKVKNVAIFKSEHFNVIDAETQLPIQRFKICLAYW